jgi:lysophospholipase L1-like esterase
VAGFTWRHQQTEEITFAARVFFSGPRPPFFIKNFKIEPFSRLGSPKRRFFVRIKNNKNLSELFSNMQNKILFIGDSITAAVPGVSYVKIIKRNHPGYNYQIKGLPQATLLDITNKLLKILGKDPNYDFIIIEAGHNDLFAPFCRTRRLERNKKPSFLARKRPITDMPDFKRVLGDRLREIQSKTSSQIILTTLGCLGENLDSKLNQDGNYINEKIKEVASELNLKVADISLEFKKILAQGNFSSYLPEYNFNLLLDLLFAKIFFWSDMAGKKRGLGLTVDGGHLNKKGAEIYAKVISEQLFTNS